MLWKGLSRKEPSSTASSISTHRRPVRLKECDNVLWTTKTMSRLARHMLSAASSAMASAALAASPCALAAWQAALAALAARA